MTRLTFGVLASSFAANMVMRQNAINNTESYPVAAQAVLDSFFVDDGLTGADLEKKAIVLQEELQELFSLGGFMLRKWKCSEPTVLSNLPHELLDSQSAHEITGADSFTIVLGVEWNATLDVFRLVIPLCKSVGTLTKRSLISKITSIFDTMGWCLPTIIKPKIMLRDLWKEKADWDQPVSQAICNVWQRWCEELPLLQECLSPRNYCPKSIDIASVELHGFSDASELAYTGVGY